MENWQLALIVVSAILVGALIPMISQYRSTMRSWERLIRDNEADVRRSIREIAEISAQLNRAGTRIQANAKHVEAFFETFGNITDGVKRLSGTVRTASVFGAAFAPAVTAAIRALQPQGDGEQQPERFEETGGADGEHVRERIDYENRDGVGERV